MVKKAYNDPTRWSSGVPGEGEDLCQDGVVIDETVVNNNENKDKVGGNGSLVVERPEDPAELNAAIVKVIDAATEKGKDDEGFFKKFFTKSGAPAVEELEAALGYGITAAERDAAVTFIEERNGGEA